MQQDLWQTAITTFPGAHTEIPVLHFILPVGRKEYGRKESRQTKDNNTIGKLGAAQKTREAVKAWSQPEHPGAAEQATPSLQEPSSAGHAELQGPRLSGQFRATALREAPAGGGPGQQDNYTGV